MPTSSSASVTEFFEQYAQKPDLNAMRPEGGSLSPEEIQEYLLRADASKSIYFVGDELSERRENIRLAAARFLEALNDGKIGDRTLTSSGRREFLRASMSYQDFPDLFGYVLDRQVLPMFDRAESPVQRIVRRTSLTDFKEVERYKRGGGRARYNKTGQGAPVQGRRLDVFKTSYRPSKYTTLFQLHWEDFINDDVNIFGDLAQRIVDGAMETIDRFITELMIDASGWLDTAFRGDTESPSAPDGTDGAGIITTPSVLSETTLDAAFSKMNEYLDRGNEVPLGFIPDFIMVSPERQLATRSLLRSVNIDAGGGTARPELNKVGGLMDEGSMLINRYIKSTATSASASRQAEMWSIFKAPDANGAFIEWGGLQGFDTPQLFARQPDVQNLGGGTVDWMHGDFSTQINAIKGMIVFGGVRLDSEYAVANQGAA